MTLDGPVSAEEAEFEDYANSGAFLPCQLLPPSFFMHRVNIDQPTVYIKDTYVAAEACANCPLREQCEKLGKDEPYGMWGGVSRTKSTGWRRCYEGDYPYE